MAYTQRLFDPLIDSEETVLAIRAKAMAMALEGKTVLQWQGEGTSANKQFTMPVEQVLEETRYFLKTKNPLRYGYITNRAKVIFS